MSDHRCTILSHSLGQENEREKKTKIKIADGEERTM